MRWLERYLTEGSPRLQHFAEVAADLARRKSGGSRPLCVRGCELGTLVRHCHGPRLGDGNF